MKAKHILFAALGVALAASCSSDDGEQGATGGTQGATDSTKAGVRTVTLTASTPETRVGMTKSSDTSASLYWQTGDKILVQTVSNGTYGGAEFGIKSGEEAGSNSIKFTGEMSGSVGAYAVYPYSTKHKFDTSTKTKLTYNLPSTYTYTTVDSAMFSGTSNGKTVYRSTSTNIPMLGTITDNKVSFKMLGSLAVIRISRMPAASGTLKVTANEKLCGDFTADMSATNAAISTSSTTTTAEKTVTFTFSGATKGSAGVFYLPLATGSYTGVKVAVTCGGSTQTIECESFTATRGQARAIGLYNSNGTLYTIDSNGYATINGHTFIDLGLSVVWATCNVGATTSTGYGNYYAWGETATKTNYDDATYKHGQSKTGMTKYSSSDGLTTLEPSDDAAYVNWGSAFRMPTRAEMDNLNNSTNCTWDWTTENNVYGYKVTSMIKGHTNRYIFLPAAGYYLKTNLLYPEKLRGEKELGFYWVSTFEPKYGDAYTQPLWTGMSVTTSGTTYTHAHGAQLRYVGCTIRAVADK